MPKQNLLDRLPGAMKTLGKRKGKTLTPRQRVAAAQRWNSLADIGIRGFESIPGRPYHLRLDLERQGIIEPISQYDYARADNPFLSDNIDKYREQSDFLEWCRYNGLEPNGRNLKQYRWETYKTLPYRERQWIANKNDMLETVGPEDPMEFRNARTLRDWDAASEEWMGSRWDMQNLPVYESLEEFPDDLDYMWMY